MIRIVKGEAHHLKELTRLENECILQPWPEESIKSELCSGDSFFDVAEENSVPVGFCILHRAGFDGELYQIGVTEKARRRGIGDALMESLLRRALREKLENVFLEVRRSNLPAIAMYKKHGFTEIHIRKNYYSLPAEDALILKREILPEKREIQQ